MISGNREFKLIKYRSCQDSQRFHPSRRHPRPVFQPKQPSRSLSYQISRDSIRPTNMHEKYLRRALHGTEKADLRRMVDICGAEDEVLAMSAGPAAMVRFLMRHTGRIDVATRAVATRLEGEAKPISQVPQPAAQTQALLGPLHASNGDNANGVQVVQPAADAPAVLDDQVGPDVDNASGDQGAILGDHLAPNGAIANGGQIVDDAEPAIPLVNGRHNPDADTANDDHAIIGDHPAPDGDAANGVQILQRAAPAEPIDDQQGSQSAIANGVQALVDQLELDVKTLTEEKQVMRTELDAVLMRLQVLENGYMVGHTHGRISAVEQGFEGLRQIGAAALEHLELVRQDVDVVRQDVDMLRGMAQPLGPDEAPEYDGLGDEENEEDFFMDLDEEYHHEHHEYDAQA